MSASIFFTQRATLKISAYSYDSDVVAFGTTTNCDVWERITLNSYTTRNSA